MFSGIRGVLQQRLADYESGRDIREWAEKFTDTLEQTADFGDQSTGTLINILTKKQEPIRDAAGWKVGIGDQGRIGSSSIKPPEHTIAEFLKDHGYPLRSGFDSRYAWWALSSDQKAELAAARSIGMYGGTPGRAPYYYVQDGHLPSGQASASKAGITPTHFMERAIALFWAWLVEEIGSKLI